MDISDRLRYRALQRKSTELYNAKKYQEAMNIDKDLVKEFPDLKTAIYYSLIATASKLENYNQSSEFLKEILDEGGWYSELILRQSPSLNPLQGMSEFEKLVTISINRSKQAPITKNITVVPDDTDPPFPLMLSMHGGGGFIEDEFESWKSIVEKGYILGIPRSSNQYWSGKDSAYWPAYESSVTEIRKFIDEINRDNIVDSERVYLGGFSQGGAIAIQMVLTGDISARGFVVVAPGGGMMDEPERWQSIIDESRNHELRGLIIRGTEDLAIPRENLTDFVQMLNEGGIPCQLLEPSGLGQWYPMDMGNIVTSFLE